MSTAAHTDSSLPGWSPAKPRFSLILFANKGLYWAGWVIAPVVWAVQALVSDALLLQDQDDARAAFEAFGMMAGLALAATAIIIAGTPAHQRQLEVVRAWNQLINAIVLNTAAWAAATFLALAAWLTGWTPLGVLAMGVAALAGFWGIRGYWWACMAITKFRKVT